MKKISLVLIIILLALFAGAQDEGQEDDKYAGIKKAYAFLKEELVLSETDLYCAYFIANKIAPDIIISGAEKMETGKTIFGNGEKMYINKGADSGIYEGDVFLVLTKGKKISNQLNGKTLGVEYRGNALAEVTCLYEKNAVVTLNNVCNPAKLGDILIPYKRREPMVRLKTDYRDCKLPRATPSVEGNVVYIGFDFGVQRNVAGTTEYATIDLGKALVSPGTEVLLYRKIKKNLPPIITGTAIVVHAQNTNSTVKILTAAFPTALGTRCVVLPEMKREKTVKSAKTVDDIKDDDPGDQQAAPGKETLEVNIYFEINRKKVDDRFAGDFEKIKRFIDAKPDYEIVLRGFACSIGGLEYNLKLSNERVENVKSYLVNALGVDPSRIQSFFYGEKDAPFDNTSEDQRRKNRMVGIRVIEK